MSFMLGILQHIFLLHCSLASFVYMTKFLSDVDAEQMSTLQQDPGAR